MANVFFEYMNDGLKSKENTDNSPRPVITIGREYGCYSTEIAKLLVKKINQKKSIHQKWECVSGQVLDAVAERLNVPVSKVSHIFGANEKGIVEDFFSSFSVTNQNISDSVIISTIADIMTTSINKGNVVIVGRAGCIFAKNNPKALHVRIVAPFDWRVQSVMKRYKFSEAQAKKQVLEIDEKRRLFMTYYNAYNRDYELFDIILNRATLSNDEIVSAIIHVAESRSLLV